MHLTPSRRCLRSLLSFRQPFNKISTLHAIDVFRHSPRTPVIVTCSKINLARFYSDDKTKDEKVSRPPSMGTRKDKEAPKGPISWFNLGVSGVIVGIMMAFYFYARDKKEQALARDRRKTLGKAKIGGSFELLDHNGKLTRSEDFHGKWVFIYFGFTHCPDICPEELEKLGEVVDMLSTKAKSLGEVQPLFISVDPKRDGVKEVGEYVKEFHPRLIGLTGSEEQVGAACKSYRVYFSAGPRDDDDDYIVDHTIIIYLVNPDGDFVDYYGQTKNADMITNSVMLHMGTYNSANKKSMFSFG